MKQRRGFFDRKKIWLAVLLLVIIIVSVETGFVFVKVKSDENRQLAIGAQQQPNKIIVSKDQGRVVYIVNLRSSADREDVMKMIEAAESARQKGCSLYRCPSNPIIVEIIYNNNSNFSFTRSERYNNPPYNWHFKIEVNSKSLSYLLSVIIPHEMTHVVHRQALNNYPPFGILEPSAELIAGVLIKERVIEARGRICKPSSQKVLTGPATLFENIILSELYNSASSLLLYLLLNEGGFDNWNSYTKRGLISGYNEETFRAIYGMNFADLDKKWLAWEERVLPAPHAPSPLKYLEIKYGKKKFDYFLSLDRYYDRNVDGVLKHVFGITFEQWREDYKKWVINDLYSNPQDLQKIKEEIEKVKKELERQLQELIDKQLKK